jgi:molecular chaperone GrpE
MMGDEIYGGDETGRRKEDPLTAEENRKEEPGDVRRVEIGGHSGPDEVPVTEEGDSAQYSDADGEEAEGSKKARKSGGKESGHRRSKKATRAEIADHLARKNEMLQKLRERLVETEESLELKEDRLIRLAAEFENYKKRTRREWDLLKNQANAGLLTEILGILDDLDRAFEHSGDSIEQFRNGIALIHSSLLDLLRRNGLMEIEALGRAFDPQYHEAVAEMHSEEVESGFVAEVVLKGYMLNDQVLRPARVVVSKGSEE